ncbi:hypothetical protein GGX14DRAFT_640470, partial [Mycena pura]
LVLHESSSCDVCLEGYTWLTPENTPHAIPCGHVFCKSCLESVEPANCPLCRRPYLRDRIKKLHVDRPDADEERDWLQRVVLAFDAETEERDHLTTDLEEWFRERSEDDHSTLRKAWAAFNAYNKLNSKRRQDKQIIKQHQLLLRQQSEESDYAR